MSEFVFVARYDVHKFGFGRTEVREDGTWVLIGWLYHDQKFAELFGVHRDIIWDYRWIGIYDDGLGELIIRPFLIEAMGIYGPDDQRFWLDVVSYAQGLSHDIR